MPEEEGVGKKILNTLFGAWGPGEGATFVQEPGIGMLPSSFQWGDWLKGSYDKIKRGDVAGGISQGIRTLGQTAAPFALPAALYKAPLAAPLGMVGSSILSSETEQRLKEAGVSDGRAALAGDVAGMVVGVPGAKKPTLNQKINNRNSVYRSTDPVAALTYLDEGVINPGPMAIRRARAKNLNLPDDTQFISTSRAPRSSSHMDWVTFEIDAAKMPPKSTPLQGLPSWHKPKGNFEFETAATQPIPLEAVKVIRINTDRPKFVSDVPYLQQQYIHQVAALKKKAAAYGIPVVEGSTKDHMLSRLTGK